MRNMRYFCSVKCTRLLFALLVAFFVLLANNEIYAADNRSQQNYFHADSIEISLLTCAPGQEVYSLYGHTAIRVTDDKTGEDFVVNYGMFSFNKPFFILRFVFGLTDYDMGITPFSDFQSEYQSEGRYVIQQVLNLTRQEKEKILNALAVNYQLENRTYRYNYFYDNCTTRARDILVSNINGTVEYGDESKEFASYRNLIHQYNTEHLWARYGNDLLLGVKADRKTDIGEHQFLPLILENDFSHAVIKGPDGSVRPLVSRQFYVVSITENAIETSGSWLSALSPVACSWLFLAIVVCVILAEMFTKKNFWLFDSLLMLIVGCAGVVLFLMIFSQHPTTSLNLQILMLNPIPLFYIWRVAKNARRKRLDAFWKYAIVAIILFLVGELFQDYAEGMSVLALSLLIRSVWTITLKYKARA